MLTATQVGGPAPGQLTPVLVEAKGRYPPEDVGGPSGYQRFVKAFSDPRHRDHKEMAEWYGGPFDPSVPDTATHQHEVSKLAKRWQPRKPR